MVPSPSPLFTAVPACANWEGSSKKITFDFVCQFQRASSGVPDVFDGGNFSYGLLLGRPGDARQFGLTVDPDIVMRVRRPPHADFSVPSHVFSFPLCHSPLAGARRRLEHRVAVGSRTGVGDLFIQRIQRCHSFRRRQSKSRRSLCHPQSPASTSIRLTPPCRRLCLAAECARPIHDQPVFVLLLFFIYNHDASGACPMSPAPSIYLLQVH